MLVKRSIKAFILFHTNSSYFSVPPISRFMVNPPVAIIVTVNDYPESSNAVIRLKFKQYICKKLKYLIFYTGTRSLK